MLSWEKPLVKPMAPGSLSYYIASLLFTSHLVYYFAIFTFQSIHQKYQKYLLYYLYQISLLRVTINGALVASSWLFVQVFGDLCVVSYWIDTLVLKNWGKYLRYFAASPFPLQGKTNTCSRGSILQETKLGILIYRRSGIYCRQIMLGTITVDDPNS